MGCSRISDAGYWIYSGPEVHVCTEEALARSLIQIVNTQVTMTNCHAEQAIEAKWNGSDRQLSNRAFAVFILIWLALGLLAVFVA